MPCQLCGARAIVSLGGVDVSGESLCQLHYPLRHGLAAMIREPIVREGEAQPARKNRPASLHVEP